MAILSKCELHEGSEILFSLMDGIKEKLKISESEYPYLKYNNSELVEIPNQYSSQEIEIKFTESEIKLIERILNNLDSKEILPIQLRNAYKKIKLNN